MNYQYSDALIIVFAKAPIAGQVKTRLMPDLTAQQAANVHIQLTQRTLALVTNLALCPVQLWCSPDLDHPFFDLCQQRYSISLHIQQGDDLGQRMNFAVCQGLEQAQKVLLIGSDCPTLTANEFELALSSLECADNVVIAPAEDGGYVMIGLNRPQPDLLLNMTWSQPQVFAETSKRIKALGLRLVKTTQQWDVDTFTDYQRFTKLQ